jgi:transposase
MSGVWAVARLVAGLVAAPRAPRGVAVDDWLSRRSGRKVHGAGWQHDGPARSRGRLGFGTCFVVAGIVVALPCCTRPVCLPVLARLVLPGTKARPAGRGHKAAPAPGTKVPGAVSLVTQLAAAFPGRAVHVVADAAYHGPALRQLPACLTWTTPLPANAALYALAPPRLPGERGRPCLKGLRPGTPAELAAAAT